MKKKEATYALSLSFHHETKHYRIDQRKQRDGLFFAVERGPSFDNLMDVRRTGFFAQARKPSLEVAPFLLR